jgi:rare lipoprotein A
LSRRANAYVVALLGVSVGTLSVPALGLADSGGGSLPSGSGQASTSTTTSAVVSPGNVTVSASGNGVSVATRASALLRNRLRFTGTVASKYAGRTIEIERLGHQTGWSWAQTAHSTIRGDGSFTVMWRTNHIGRFSIRAVIEGSTSSHAAAASPSLSVTVYRPSIATQYGPGFYGQRTACGQVLRTHTLGVANRTLRCGTPVAIYYRGRTIVVPVIDRGPYANHADWDLTEATGRALGIDGTARIGAVSLPSR